MEEAEDGSGGQDRKISPLAALVEVDAVVFCVGVLVWFVWRCTTCRCIRHQEAGYGHLTSATARYYVLFLRTCRDLFTTLTVLAGVVVTPAWGLAPLSLGFLSGPHELREVRGACASEGMLPIGDEDACERAGELLETMLRFTSGGCAVGLPRRAFVCRQEEVRFSMAGANLLSTGSLDLAEPLPDALHRAERKGTAQLVLSAGLTADRVALLCLLSALLSLASLVFLDWLQKQIRQADSVLGMEGHFLVLERTLWLQDLPAADSQTDEPFTLDSQEIERIEKDLQEELEKNLQEKARCLPLEGVPIVERIHVAPVVDEWHSLSALLLDSREREDAFHALALAPGATYLGGMMRHWYRFRRKFHARRSKVYQERLRKIIVGKKQLSGSAFVTFRTPEQRAHFLQEEDLCNSYYCPQWHCWHFCWHCTRGTFFTFGHIPFASVTLRCQQAPDPSDILWTNLHVSRFNQFARLFALAGILFVVMETFIAILVLFPHSGVIEEAVGAPAFEAFRAVHGRCLEALNVVFSVVASLLRGLPQNISEHVSGLGAALTAGAPVAGVVAGINFLVLPGLTRRIVGCTREHLRSHMDIKHLHLNVFFLFFNLFAVPSLAFVVRFVEAVWHQQSRESAGDDLVSKVRSLLLVGLSQFQKSQGALLIPYMVHAMFLANLACLFPLGRYLSRLKASVFSVTARDWRDANAPQDFQFSFWYAWGISMFAAGILLSVFIPSVLPCAALFFALKYAIDHHDLSAGVYEYSRSDNARFTFIPRVFYYISCIIAVWWLLLGASFAYWSHALAHRWSTLVPAWWVQAWASSLIVGSVVLFVLAHVSLHAIIHAASFDRLQNVLGKNLAVFSRACPVVLARIHDWLACLFGQMPLPRSGSMSVDCEEESVALGRTISMGGTLLWDAKTGCTEDLEAVQPALRFSMPCGRPKVAYL